MTEVTESIRIRLQFEADQAEKAANRMERQLLALEGRYDPLANATKRLDRDQRVLAKAFAAGSIDAQKHATLLANVEAEYADATARARGLTDALEDTAVASSRLNSSFGAAGGLRNTALQLSQVAQQGSVTGNYLQALAIQLPDLAMGFGPVGIAAGAVAGVLATVGLGFLGAGEDAVDAADSIDVLIGSLDRYTSLVREATTPTAELRAEWGRFTADIRADNIYLAQVEIARLQSSVVDMSGAVGPAADTIRAMMAEIKALTDDGLGEQLGISNAIVGMQESATRAAQELGLTSDQVLALDTAFNQFNGAESLEEIRAGAVAVFDEIQKISPEGQGLASVFADAAEHMGGVIRATTSAILAQEGLNRMAEGTAPPIGSAADTARDLAGGISQASAFAAQLVTILGQVPSAVASIGAQVDSAMTALQNQNTSLARQLERGITASSAGILQMRDDALAAAAANGATADTLMELGLAYDAQAAQAEKLARENTAMTSTLSEQAAAAAKAAAGLSGGSGGGGRSLSAGAREAEKTMRDAEKEAEALAKQIEKLEFDADPVKRYRAELAKLDELRGGGLSDGAYASAVADLNDGLAQSMPLVNDLSTAFGDWIASGLTDFEGFVSSVLGSFKSMISEMVATALRNRIIMPMMGVVGGGAGAGAVAGAAGSIPGLGAVGGIGAAFGSGLSSVIGGIGAGGLSGGIGAIGTALSGATTGLAGLATAAGAIALPLAAAYGVFRAFKGSTKDLDAGIRLTIDGNRALAESYKTTQRSRFFGLSKRSRTSESALTGTGVEVSIAAAYQSAEQAAWALGLSSKALRGFTQEVSFSTRGMDEAAIQAKLLGIAQDAANGFAMRVFTTAGAGLSGLVQPGEAAGAALERIRVQMAVAAPLLDALGGNIARLGVSGARASQAFIAGLGGLENAGQAVQSFMGTFYTVPEQIEQGRKALTGLMQDLGGSGAKLPQSIEAYRALVDRQLAAGNASVAGQLIAASGQFAQWLEMRNGWIAEERAVTQAGLDAERAARAALVSERTGLYLELWREQGRTADLRKYELDQLIPANRAIQESIWALQDKKAAEEAAADASQKAADALRDMLDGTIFRDAYSERRATLDVQAGRAFQPTYTAPTLGRAQAENAEVVALLRDLVAKQEVANSAAMKTSAATQRTERGIGAMLAQGRNA